MTRRKKIAAERGAWETAKARAQSKRDLAPWDAHDEVASAKAAHAAALAASRRASVTCPCGRNVVEDEADAEDEIKGPCPDCGERCAGRVMVDGRGGRVLASAGESDQGSRGTA